MSPQMKHIIRVFVATALALTTVVLSEGIDWVTYAVIPIHAAIVIFSAFVAAYQKDKIKIEAAHKKAVEEHDQWIADIEKKYEV